MGKSDGEFPEFFLIQNTDAAPGHFDHALLGEVLEHSRYHFPGTSHIFGDLFMGEIDPGVAGLGELVQQEDGQTLIKPHEEQLFHGPHHIGKPVDHQRIGEVFGIDVLLDELLILG